MPGSSLPDPTLPIDYTLGTRMFSGNHHQRVLDFSASYLSGLTAKASGGQSGATLLGAAINEVTTVGTAADSVQLPLAVPGMRIFVINAAASNAMQVFGNSAGSDTINGTAGSTGVSQAAGKAAVYVCPVAGKWYRLLSA